MKKGDYLTFGPGTLGTFDNQYMTGTFPVTFGFTAEAIAQQRIYNVAQVENEFSARIANNGTTASIVSQSSPFIESVVRDATGEVTINLKSGMFTSLPSVTAVADVTGSSANVIITDVEIIDLNTIKVYTDTSSASAFDESFNIHVSRQDSDRRDLQKAIVKLDEFPRVNRTISKNYIASLNADLTVNTVLESHAQDYITIDNPAANDLRFTAKKACNIDLAATFSVAGVVGRFIYVDVYKNGTKIGNVSAYCDSGENETGSINITVALNSGDTILLDRTGFSGAIAEAYVVLNVQAQDLERVTNIDQTENHFAARVSSAAAIVSQSEIGRAHV